MKTKQDVQPLLELRGVSKNFGAIQALTRVDMDVYRGEVVALVGDNGAGKSTLIKGIAGIYNFDEGETYFDGIRCHIGTPRDAAKLGIEVVYQDLALADNLDVVSNMFLGREKLQPNGNTSGIISYFRNLFPIREVDMEKQAVNTLNELSVTTLRSVRLPVASLSGGQRQSVAIAKAVLWNSKLVILDEPTAALGVAQTRQVLNLVRRLAERGLGVVMISHNLHDIFEVADRVTVLRLGHKVATYDTKESDQKEIVHAMTAGQLSTVPGMA